jgi:D-alanyl-D-alanine carboxypeptidase
MTQDGQSRLQGLIKQAKTWRAASRKARVLPYACLSVCLSALVLAGPAWSSPKATLIMDARTGQVFAEENADLRLHPASLTKMMTLYLAFEAVERGELSMDSPIRISPNAADEIPSKLGLKAGQDIQLRYLVRAAAVKSANDAATAIAEGISGSEGAFIERMNRTARAMGMTSTHFENAHGLTEPTHLSTARDMSLLARHLLFDYPEYYNLFSRLSADAGIAHVAHTNRSFLTGYEGADGIKTGYTRAAGYNLVASAARGSERIIATIFGARSVSERTRLAAELIDRGFAAAPTRVVEVPPQRPMSAGPVLASTPAPASSARDHPLHGSFSYEALIAGRRTLGGEVIAAANPIVRRGEFKPVAIPQGPRQFQNAKPHPADEILAGATAVIADLKGGRRDATHDSTPPLAPAPITRAGMSDLERALARGAEIPMGPAAARQNAPRRGGFAPVALPHPIAQGQPAQPAAPQAPAMTDLFNIDDLYRVPDLPANSIFSRTGAESLPTGPLVTPTRPRARDDMPAPREALPAQQPIAAPQEPTKGPAVRIPQEEPHADEVAADAPDTKFAEPEEAPVDPVNAEEVVSQPETTDQGPQPITLPW